MSSKTELLPCPLCGCKEVKTCGYADSDMLFVLCPECGVTCDVREDMSPWNDRAAPVVERQPAAQKYDDTLLPFVALMRKELHSNEGKGDRPGWLAMSADTCMLEIIYHFGKLQASVKRGDGDGINEYAADVANMCMMLTDICGSLAYAEITAPPELAELQATIAQQAAEVVRIKTISDNYSALLMDANAEIERLKGGHGEPVSVGYKLVPLTPTPAMVEAGINTRCGDDEHQDYRDVYAAMIGAAP